MNDLWNFIQGLGDGLQGAMSATSLVAVMFIGLLIGLFTNPSRPAIKALIAVVLVFAIRMVPALVNSGRLSAPTLPDFRHLSAVVEIFLMYVFAYGLIAVIGALKTGLKMGSAKAAH